jgi:hypothetical protein
VSSRPTHSELNRVRKRDTRPQGCMVPGSWQHCERILPRKQVVLGCPSTAVTCLRPHVVGPMHRREPRRMPGGAPLLTRIVPPVADCLMQPRGSHHSRVLDTMIVLASPHTYSNRAGEHHRVLNDFCNYLPARIEGGEWRVHLQAIIDQQNTFQSVDQGGEGSRLLVRCDQP